MLFSKVTCSATRAGLLVLFLSFLIIWNEWHSFTVFFFHCDSPKAVLRRQELILNQQDRWSTLKMPFTEGFSQYSQHFLDCCHKRHFVSFPVSIKDLLYRQDCKILKAITSVDNHPLGSILPPKKNKYNFRIIWICSGRILQACAYRRCIPFIRLPVNVWNKLNARQSKFLTDFLEKAPVGTHWEYSMFVWKYNAIL